MNVKIFRFFLSQNIFAIAFIGCLIYSLWAIGVGWNHTILDAHGFRQTQTAISTYYLIRGGPWLAYETPVFGAPWSIPLEFPFYQWIVAVIVKLFGTPLDPSGRFVSACFFYLSLIPIYFTLHFLKISWRDRWIFFCLFITSPLYLFWSRTFTIESTALFFSLAYLASICYYLDRKSIFALILGSLFGVLAVLVKVTTFLSYFLAATLLIYRHRQKIQKLNKTIVYKLAVPTLAFALVPYIAISIWTHFSDFQKSLNPVATDLISRNLTRWNFGTLEQKLSPEIWRSVLNQVFHDLWGQWQLSVIVLTLLLLFTQFKRLYFISIALFLSAILVFTNLHYVHNYYAYANAIFLIAATGFGIAGLLAKKGNWKALGWAICTLLLVLQVRAYFVRCYPVASQNATSVLGTTRAIQKYTNPQDVILVDGDKWSSQIPYYSQRRAVMGFGLVSPDAPVVKQVLKNLSQYNLGAMIFCHQAKSDREHVRLFTSAYGFQSDPVYSDSICQIHLSSGDRKRSP